MPTPARRRWRLARRSTGYLGAGAIVCIAFFVLAIAQFLPWIERNPDKVASWLSDRVGRSVRFDAVHTRWTRQGPLLRLEGLRIGSVDEEVRIDQADVVLAMYSGWLPGNSFTELRLRELVLTLVEDEAGQWSVRGFPASRQPGSDPLNYLEGLGELRVINGRVQLISEAKALDMTLPQVDLRMLVDKKTARVGLRGWIQNRSTPVFASFRLDRVSKQGDLYLDVKPDDFAAWTTLPYYAGIKPISGNGRVQIWADFADGGIRHLTVDTKLRQLIMAGAPLIDEDFDTKAPVGAIRMLALWQRTPDGWRLDFPEFQIGDDADAQRLNGLTLAGGEHQAALIDRLRAKKIFSLLALSDRLSPSLRYWLTKATPEVEFSNVVVARDVASDRWRFEGDVAHLKFAAVGINPGIDGLSGHIAGDGDGAVLSLNEMPVRFDWEYGFRRVHSFVLRGQLALWREDDGWKVGTSALQLEGDGLEAQARGALWFQEGKSRPHIDLAIEFEDFAIPLAKQYWSTNIMSANAVKWLDDALEGGTMTQGHAVIAGDLADWPFDDKEGQFVATGTIRDGRVAFHPDWPILEQSRLTVQFVRNGFHVEGAGLLGGVRVQGIRASMSDYTASGLDVAATSPSDSSQLLALLKKSPLQASHREVLDSLAVNGPASTTLAMHIPLANDRQLQTLDGCVRLQAARLAEKNWDLEFTAVTGDIRYDHVGFIAPALAVKHDGRDGVLALRAGRHVNDASQSFEGDLSMSLDIVELFQRAPQLGWLKPYIYGRSEWTIGVTVSDAPQGNPGTSAQLRLRSDLVGTSLAFPAPLAKAPEAPLSTTAVIDLPFDKGQIDVAFGHLLALQSRTQNDQTGVQVTLGSARVNGDPPVSGLIVSGNAQSIDALEWITLAKGGDRDEGQMPLRMVDVRTDQLHLFGSVFPDAQLRMDPQENSLQVTVDGPALAGELYIPDVPNAAIVGRFSRAYWKKRENTVSSSPRPVVDVAPTDPAALPELVIDIGDMRYGDLRLGQVTLKTRPVPGGMRIQNATAVAATHRAHIDGEWLGVGPMARTRLQIRVDSNDFGVLVDQFDYAGMMRGGEGHLLFDASWPGSPDAFKLEALQGSFKVDIRNGQLLEVEPGAGRFLGLLSVAQLPRRLILDFRDFFSKGFGFNQISGSVRFFDGAAESDGIAIEGPAADIHIAGATNLHTEQFNQTVDVRPRSGNLLTVVGAVAAGPVGAAVGVVASAALGKPMGDIGAKTYLVTGPWKDPQIEVIGREQSDRAMVRSPASGASDSSSLPTDAEMHSQQVDTLPMIDTQTDSEEHHEHMSPESDGQEAASPSNGGSSLPLLQFVTALPDAVTALRV